MICDDGQAYEVNYSLERAARTGNYGDGKIYVTEVVEAIRIQTSEREPVAA